MSPRIEIFDIECDGFKTGADLICLVSLSVPSFTWTIHQAAGPGRGVTPQQTADFVRHLNGATTICSHNGIAFDAPRIEFHGGVKASAPHFDTLAQIKSKAGSFKGWKLENMAQAMLGHSAKPDGLTGGDMPKLYAEGRIDECVEACKGDVLTLAQIIHRMIAKRGQLDSPTGRVTLTNYARLVPYFSQCKELKNEPTEARQIV